VLVLNGNPSQNYGVPLAVWSSTSSRHHSPATAFVVSWSRSSTLGNFVLA